jgi:signal peptidase I
MSGSGARDGFGSPPWDPADPVPHPDLDDTQALPGLGSISGPAGPGPAPGGPSGDPRFGGGTGGTLFDGSAKGSARADETRVDLKAAVDETDAPDAAGGGRRGGKRDDGKDGRGGKRRRSFLRELPVLVVVAVVLALLIKSFVIQAFYIPSASMENTLEIGDRVLISKIVY